MEIFEILKQALMFSMIGAVIFFTFIIYKHIFFTPPKINKMENQSKKYTLKTTESGDIFFTPDTKPIDLTDNSTALFERQKKLESDIDLLIREFNRDTGLLPKAINLQVTDLGMRRFKLKKVIADVPLSY